ncbi:MAG TPA: acyltransferase [Arcobacter sp.]|nr:acyltransferase [Arcobacter sp.]
MINKLIYIIRYYLQIKLNKKITSNGFVILQSNVKLIVEEGGGIVFRKSVTIKEHSVIYAKKNAKIIFGDNTSTGHHTEISANTFIEIGSDVIMGAYTYITDSNHGYKDSTALIRKQAMESGKVSIGDNVWLGRSVMVLKDANIGDNSIVGAGSIVTKKFKNNVILAGVPAKVIKDIYE